jgi:DNA-binding beta-propeller fold protein YncE
VGVRCVERLSVIALCALAGTLALCGPASALIARGHVFGSSFGAQGKGDGEFEAPTQVAVEEETGELYVVDSGNERVEIFKPGSHGEYEYVSEFKVRTPGAIAVDNSTNASDPSRGDVYVAGSEEKGAEPSERDIVYEYRPSEEKVVRKLQSFKSGEEEEEFADISGLAVDSSGTLWVYWEEDGIIDGFAKRLNKAQTKAELVWEPSLRREPEVESKFNCSARAGFAVAPDDESFYVGYERENDGEDCPGEEEETPDPLVIGKLNGTQPTPGIVARDLDHENTTGVAVDGTSGEIYLDNGDSVAAFTSTGLLTQRFGEGDLAGGSGVAVDADTGDVFVAESGADKIELFKPEEELRAPVVDDLSSQNLTPTSSELRAQIDPGGAETEYYFRYGTLDCASDPSSCTQTPVPAGEIKAGFGDEEVSVEVKGLQPATAYYYVLFAQNSADHAEDVPSPNTFTTLESPSALPDGRAWEMVSPPEKHGAAIESITRYSGGSIQASLDGEAIVWLASGPVVREPEGNRSFEPTQLFSSRGPDGWSSVSLETPHEQGRGLELPSPSEYHFFSPDLSQSLLQPVEPTRQVGGVFEHPPLSPEASEKTIYLRRDPPASAGYLPLVTAANDTAGTRFGGALEFLDASSDLSHVIFESKMGLTAGALSAAGLYEWQADAPLALVSVLPDGLPLADEPSIREPTLGDGGGLNARDAISSDGTRVVWSEDVAFIPERLYLRDTQTSETIQVNASQGHGSTERGVAGEEVPEPAEGQQEVHFQSASSDGSKVFFTDTARLSEESSEEPTGEDSAADLYEFEVTSGPGEPLRGRLSDLTPDATAGSADVLNLIPGISEDGSDVYFIANGVLAPGATPGECPHNAELEPPPPTATCNLYLSEPDPEHRGQRETRFVAALSSLDAADWGAGISGSGTASSLPPSQDLSAVTSNVSVNGQYLTFMSERSLTGYDNRDATSGQTDEEVFLYDADGGRLVCASCNPNPEGEGEGEGEGESFKRPQGVFDTQLSGEGFGLLVDRPEIWKERWLAGSVPGWGFNIIGGGPAALYQPRYLSDSGRLFFDSPDDLVPAAQNHKEDVYEYEPDGVGSCQFSSGCIGLISSGSASEESAFLDANENGNDVFFLTAAQLVPADTDQAFDIYDAHVCSGSSPCHVSQVTSTQECETSQACKGTPAAQPQLAATPASATFSGQGNVAKGVVLPSKSVSKPKPLTQAQKLAKSLRACRKIKKKHRRQACEAQARKRYDLRPKKAKAKKSARPSEAAARLLVRRGR